MSHYSWTVQTAQIANDFWPFFVGIGFAIPTKFLSLPGGPGGGVLVYFLPETLKNPGF